MKGLRLPAPDAQAVLGQTRISTTLEVYTDSADEAKRDAITRLHGLLDNGQYSAAATEDGIHKSGLNDHE
jgi:hypothetical protein